MGRRVLVTGAGGFIGHHLVKYLVARGHWVRGVDLKQPEFEPSPAHEFLVLDLRERRNCERAAQDIEHVYHLAADMGGIGYISVYRASVARNNLLINLGMLEASRLSGVERFFFASSACIYPVYRQASADVSPLREEDAYPALPEEGYGWEKLTAEKLCHYYREDYGLETRIARFHNVYGPLGAYEGGREKAPAALCRKIALARDGDEIEVWGDGRQTRSFLYIADCVEGIYRIMQSDYPEPLNLGADRLVTIDELVGLIAQIAGKRIRVRHNLNQPQGVRGRNSDNTRLRAVLGWEPAISLEVGLRETYAWIEQQIRLRGAREPLVEAAG
jgi:nucleoside-diphosphate-sugar epimerase